MSLNIRPLLLGACTAFSLLTLPASAQQQTADDSVLAGLAADVRTGEAAEAELRRVRDRQLADLRDRDLSPAQREAKIKNVLDTYRRESSKLVAQYRQPFIEELQRRNPGLQDSMGTSLYLTDDNGARQIGPDGKPILNPDFRGWSGDHDMQGSPATVQRVRNALAQQGIAMTGAGSLDLKTLTPGDLSADQLELTINVDPTDQHFRNELSRLDAALATETEPAARARLVTERNRAERSMWAARQSDSMLTPGDTAHETVARVAAASKETYVVASMGTNQIARQAVAVNDHYKKAVPGFALNGDALMDPANESAFQGMVKGTGKALKDSGLDDAALQDVLSRNGLLMTPQQYRKTLEDIKKNPVPDLYGLNAQTMESFRKANAAVMDKALETSGSEARQALTQRRNQLSELDARIAQAIGEERVALVVERERLGLEYVDSQIKLQAVEDANAARRTQYGLVGASRQTRVATAATVAGSPPNPTPSPSGGAGTQGGFGTGAMKALDAAGKAVDVWDYLTTTLDEAEKVVSEADPEDSDAELIARTTLRSTIRVTGFGDAIETAMLPENLTAFKDATREGNYGTAVFEWSKMMGSALFLWSAKKVEDAVITPVKNVAEASRESWLLGGALIEEGANYLRNVSEQEAQNIRLAALREQAAREEEIARELEEDAPPSDVKLVSLLNDDEPPDLPEPKLAETSVNEEGSPTLESTPSGGDVLSSAEQSFISSLGTTNASLQLSSQPSPSVKPMTLSVISVRHELYTGPLVQGAVAIGGVVAMTAKLTEKGPPGGAAEWFINGFSRKKRALSEENALGLRLDTTGMAEGVYTIALQVTDAGGALRAESEGRMRLEHPVIGQVALGVISAHQETYEGPVLGGAIRNGDIVAFNLPVTLPERSAGGTVRWQVYGPGGAAIAELVKESVISATSTSRFRFRPEGLKNGTHEVRATFVPADEGWTEQTVRASFAVTGFAEETGRAPLAKQSTAVPPASSGPGGVRWLRRIADPKDAKDPGKLYWTIDGLHLIVDTFLHNGGEGVLVHDDSGQTVSVLGDADNGAYGCIGYLSSPDKLICKDRKSAAGAPARYHMTVYSLSDGARLQDATGRPGRDVVFSPNGQRMAVAGYQPNYDGRRIIDVTLLDAATGGEVSRTDDFAPPRTGLPVDGYQNAKRAMFNGDGKVLIVLDEQEEESGRITQVHLLDGLTGSLRNTVPGNRFTSYSQAVSVDGRYALISGKRQDYSDFVELIDLSRASVLWTEDRNAREKGYVFSEDGRFLHSLVQIGENDINGSYEVRTRDVNMGNIVRTRTVPMSALLSIGERTFDYLNQIELHPDGKRIAVEAKYRNGDGRLYVFGVLE